MILAWASPFKHEMSTQCWIIVGPPATTLAQHWTSIKLMCRICWVYMFFV